MTWRGTTTVADRIFACLPYLIPLLYGVPFGISLMMQFPILSVLLIPLSPLMQVYSIPFAGLIIFFILFMAVVRNPNINHFIRFNTMQAILMNIVLFLCSLVMNYILQPVFGGGLVIETLNNTIFLGVLAAVGYAIAQSIMGRYAEIPTISEAAYTQVR
ncbi:hypothetical protein PJF56_05910 [Roseofilum sp. BLCC_M91]|uniref:Tic20 family protein n=1 Tax=Roseofilum halophilum BLCC-M91 TaxID=3022259 RepID=A0ABT7BGT1_9CYAN|nr:Tic20 family protein [Roseofilum halophilum]MDJ1178392.1 hypothetical protein [Roseofilum halophilum BLCC-M91]